MYTQYIYIYIYIDRYIQTPIIYLTSSCQASVDRQGRGRVATGCMMMLLVYLLVYVALIYIYIYIYTHLYLYTHLCVCICVHICVHLSLSLYIYIYIHIHSKQYVIFISCIVYTYEYGQATTGCLGQKKRKTRRGTDGVSTNRVTAILLFDRGWISPYLGFPFRLGFARLKKLRGYD